MKDFDTALTDFLEHITAASIADRNKNFSNLEPNTYTTQKGVKNIRVVVNADTQPSVFCFIRIADGAVLKSAGWKAPAKHARGTIFTNDPKEYGVGAYGANYLK